MAGVPTESAGAPFHPAAALGLWELLVEAPELARKPSAVVWEALRTKLPDYPTEVYLLAEAYRHGVTEPLLELTSDLPRATTNALVAQLQAAMFVSETAGFWAVQAWALALQIDTAYAPKPEALVQQLEELQVARARTDRAEFSETAAAKGSKHSLPPGFRLTPEFEAAYEAVEAGGRSLFLTGKAGTGKSTWLHYLALHTAKQFVVVAPTGVAAVNSGGTTLHSFLGLPPRPLLPNDPDLKPFPKSHPSYEVLQHLELLVIDEASMVRADVLDATDRLLRLNRKRHTEPFGGVQVVLVGDMFQLPPIVNPRDRLDQTLYPVYTRGIGAAQADDTQIQAALFGSEAYETPYVFSARVWQALAPEVWNLTEIFRQRDPHFVALLNQIRHRTADESSLAALNAQVNPEASSAAEEFAMILVPTNKAAAAYNAQALASLAHEPHTYAGEISGDYPPELLPTARQLELKVGAQVMFVRNDLAYRWVNGTLGIVEALADEYVTVRTREGQYWDVERFTWENVRYQWAPRQRRVESEVVGTFTQFPLRLAWALTIHKSQGLTFDRVTLDLGRGAFAPGQTYVALSRCRSLEGITLKQPVRPRDLGLDRNVQAFALRHGI